MTLAKHSQPFRRVRLSTRADGAQQTAELMAEVVAEDAVDEWIDGRVDVRQRHEQHVERPVGTERRHRDEVVEQRNLRRRVADDVDTDAGNQHLNNSVTTA